MSVERIRGRALQTLRLRIWTVNPRCAMCGHVTAFPGGFDLDHIKALDNGGGNDDTNYQVLCNGPLGCHEKKTATDLGYKFRVRTTTGEDGWPVPLTVGTLPRWRRAEAGKRK